MSIILLTVVTAIFIIAMFLKKVIPFRLCAICASISLTWIGLLVLQKTGKFDNGILIGILVGQSITGLYYTLSKKLNRAMRIFTLPFFLTATIIIYAIIASAPLVFDQLLFLLVIWVAAYIVFSYRHDPGKKLLVDTAMNCCGDK